MAKIILGLGMIIILFLSGYASQSNIDYSEKVLQRAKELMESLPQEEDSYGLKKIFPSACIVSATLQNNKWRLETEIDKTYSIIFVLPRTQEDYIRSGGEEKAIMATSTSVVDSPNLVYILINPLYFQEIDMTGVYLDYLATCMLHEAVHVYQRTFVLSGFENIIQKERKAYNFQIKFIDQILKDNNLSLYVFTPKLSLPVLEQMTGHGMYLLFGEVDRLNGGKLGIGLSSLIVYRQYPDLYLKYFASIENEK